MFALLPVTILARTLLFILLAVELYRLLTQSTSVAQSDEPAALQAAPE
jgi:hypothetical protein